MPENDAKSVAPTPRVYGAGHKLIGKDYVTADLYAKVTGRQSTPRIFTPKACCSASCC